MNLNKSWIQGVSCKFEDANGDMVEIAKNIPKEFLSDFQPETWLKDGKVVLYNENNSAILSNFGWGATLDIINLNHVREDISHFIFFCPDNNTYYKIAFPDFDMILKEIMNNFGEVLVPVPLQVLKESYCVGKIKIL